MHRTTKRAAKITALAATAFIASTAVANAATVNPDGTGFVGKGEVQSAYGFNNSVIQKIIDANEKAFTFTSSQSATQSLYAFGEVVWSGWVALQGENPADCLRNDNGAEIADLTDVTTYGDVVPTTTDYGTESFGETKVIATNPTGLAQVSVTYNSVTKPLPITPTV
jgi:hypothetical protein